MKWRRLLGALLCVPVSGCAAATERTYTAIACNIYPKSMAIDVAPPEGVASLQTFIFDQNGVAFHIGRRYYAAPYSSLEISIDENRVLTIVEQVDQASHRIIGAQAKCIDWIPQRETTKGAKGTGQVKQ